MRPSVYKLSYNLKDVKPMLNERFSSNILFSFISVPFRPSLAKISSVQSMKKRSMRSWLLDLLVQQTCETECLVDFSNVFRLRLWKITK